MNDLGWRGLRTVESRARFNRWALTIGVVFALWLALVVFVVLLFVANTGPHL